MTSSEQTSNASSRVTLSKRSVVMLENAAVKLAVSFMISQDDASSGMSSRTHARNGVIAPLRQRGPISPIATTVSSVRSMTL
jgi:hypothetical protein